MSTKLLLQRDGCVATLTLNNPGKLNAIDLAMWSRIAATFVELDADESLRCVIVRGADGSFVAGGDLEEFLSERNTLDKAQHYHGEVGKALAAIAACRHPTIALIEGACVGGGLEIAGQCDLRICGESSRFGAPINKLGFSMYPGEMAGLLRLVGPATVLEILIEGRILSAAEAYAKGLVTRVVADTEVANEAAATARRISAGAPLAARAHKKWVRRLQEKTPPSEEELRAVFDFLETEDYHEGMSAFFAKRPPVFTGK